MKKFIKIVFTLAVAALLVTGCEDRTELTAPSAPNPKSGSADFTTFVTIGNSLTAGYQSSALYRSAQVFGFGNLISEKTGSSFAIPFVSDPGIGGRMKIQTLDVAKGSVTFSYDGSTGTPENTAYPAPYNNLGIPGALLYDVLNATSSTTCASYVFGNPATRTPNPFFDVVLRGQGSQFSQAKALSPTFVTAWIGNNDILGFATSGGFSPSAPTSVPQFTYLYMQLADTLATLGAKVVLANIPNVTAIPFFTTVGPGMSQAIPWASIKLLGAPGMFYQKHGETVASGVADSLSLLKGDLLVTLVGSSYASLVGKPTGQFYRDKNYPSLPAGIDTTKPFGLHPQNPWPDALILDVSEIATAQTTTSAFNGVIAGAVAKYPGQFALVDFNTFFDNIRQHDYSGGSVFNGVKFFTTFLTGGLFSLDGVHPTSQGQAIIANEFLKVINASFGASYSLVDVSSIPGSLVLAKSTVMNNGIFPYFKPHAFDHLLF
ncbi:MAG: hypothetical protein K8H86_08075 [Ignavibacteriaceae bacterium]|nr:hypothetical protein [Ignavibacteriaceae bacterium]